MPQVFRSNTGSAPQVVTHRNREVVFQDHRERAKQREAARAAAIAIADEAATRRAIRMASVSPVEKVKRASVKMNGQNAAQAIKTIELASDHDREFYLLAEEGGKARKQVLQRFPAVRRAVREAYTEALQVEAAKAAEEVA